MTKTYYTSTPTLHAPSSWELGTQSILIDHNMNCIEHVSLGRTSIVLHFREKDNSTYDDDEVNY